MKTMNEDDEEILDQVRKKKLAYGTLTTENIKKLMEQKHHSQSDDEETPI